MYMYGISGIYIATCADIYSHDWKIMLYIAGLNGHLKLVGGKDRL